MDPLKALQDWSRRAQALPSRLPHDPPSHSVNIPRNVGHEDPGRIVDPTVVPEDFKVGSNGVFVVTLQPGGTAIVQIPLVSAKPIIKKTFP